MAKVDLLKAIVSLQKTIAGMTAQAVEHFDEEVRLTSDALTYKRQLSEALHELSLLKR